MFMNISATLPWNSSIPSVAAVEVTIRSFLTLRMGVRPSGGHWALRWQ
jgi:hypothetical protein